MPTTRSSRNPLQAAREIAERAARVARLELELRTVDLRRQAGRLAFGAGLGLLAVLLAPLFVVFLLATVAAGLATMMDVWLAMLIVTLLLLALVGGLAGAAALLVSPVVRGGGDDAR